MNDIECSSEEGIIIGLLDSIMVSTNVVRKLLYIFKEKQNSKRDDDNYFEICGEYGYGKPIEDALRDLMEFEPLYLLLQQTGYNSKIFSERDRKLMDLQIKTVDLLKEKVGLK